LKHSATKKILNKISSRLVCGEQLKAKRKVNIAETNLTHTLYMKNVSIRALIL